jgi:hypothetical protein
LIGFPMVGVKTFPENKAVNPNVFNNVRLCIPFYNFLTTCFLYDFRNKVLSNN